MARGKRKKETLKVRYNVALELGAGAGAGKVSTRMQIFGAVRSPQSVEGELHTAPPRDVAVCDQGTGAGWMAMPDERTGDEAR